MGKGPVTISTKLYRPSRAEIEEGKANKAAKLAARKERAKPRRMSVFGRALLLQHRTRVEELRRIVGRGLGVRATLADDLARAGIIDQETRRLAKADSTAADVGLARAHEEIEKRLAADAAITED